MSLHYWKLKAIRAVRDTKMALVSIVSRIELSRSQEPLALATRVTESMKGYGLYDRQKRSLFATHVGLLVPLARRDPKACEVLLEGLSAYASSQSLAQLQTERVLRLGNKDNEIQVELARQALKAIPHVVNQAPDVALELAYQDSGLRSGGHGERYDLLFPHIARLSESQPQLALSFARNILKAADTPRRLEAVAGHIIALAPRVAPDRMPVSTLLEHPLIGDVAGLKAQVTDMAVGLVDAAYRKDCNSGVHMAKALLDNNPGNARVTEVALHVLSLHKQDLGQIWPYRDGIYHMAQTLMQRQGIDVARQGDFVCRDFAVLASVNPATHKDIVVFLGDARGPIAMTQSGDFVRDWRAAAPAGDSDFRYSPAAADIPRIDAKVSGLLSSLSAQGNLPDFTTAVTRMRSAPKAA